MVRLQPHQVFAGRRTALALGFPHSASCPRSLQSLCSMPSWAMARKSAHCRICCRARLGLALGRRLSPCWSVLEPYKQYW